VLGIQGLPHFPHFVLLILALGACPWAAPTQAQSAYPDRPIRLIVPWPPGGASDGLARIITPKLAESMGQPWVIENHPGASGNIGAEIAARSRSDGYTVLIVLDTSITANPHLYKMFNVQRDLKPVMTLASIDHVLVTNPNVPASSGAQFIALARQKPHTLNFASAGVGSSNHLAVELIKRRGDVDIVHVAYKGGGPATMSVVSGETQLMMSSVASTNQLIKQGRLVPLATPGATRYRSLPDVPTLAESGFPGFEIVFWHGLLVPSGTPAAIVDRLNAELTRVLALPDVQAAMATLGLTPMPSTAADFEARIARESATWAKLIKESDIRAE